MHTGTFIKKRQAIVETICYLYSILFLYTASSKLMGLSDFKLQLDRSEILGPFAEWIAWMVPLLEIVLAILLLTKVYRLVALYGSLILMTLFTSYIAWMLRFSDHIPCSCGGVISSMGWETHLVFNAFWVVLALIGIVLLENLKKINI
ncbi:MauE/DoxX family redox-associated membrane protein [Muricauda sp. ANG21]|uniref:MauE/DoxX family redox-associated membrane protein n=1 Tax=Allomuricauda sp. ANG21 TaxID=3042468 RepID=UPI003451DC25